MIILRSWGSSVKVFVSRSLSLTLVFFNHGSREVNEGAHIMAHCIANWNITIVLMDTPLISLIDHLKLDGVRPTSD